MFSLFHIIHYLFSQSAEKNILHSHVPDDAISRNMQISYFSFLWISGCYHYVDVLLLR